MFGIFKRKVPTPGIETLRDEEQIRLIQMEEPKVKVVDSQPVREEPDPVAEVEDKEAAERKQKKIEEWRAQRQLKELEYNKKVAEEKKQKQEEWNRQQEVNHLAQEETLETYLGKVKWWDEEAETFKECELKLENYTAIVQLEYEIKKITLPSDVVYTFKSEEHKYSTLVFVISDLGSIMLSFTTDNKLIREKMVTGQAELIKNHFHILNNIVFNKTQKVISTINTIYENISKNDDIISLIYNYIEKTDKELFLNFKFLLVFERSLKLSNPLGATTLLIYDEDFLSTSNLSNVLNNIVNDVNLNEIYNYRNNVFIKLVKIIGRKVECKSEGVSIFSIWKIVRMIAIKYFYDLFQEKYGSYFLNISDLSIEDCALIYTKIDVINISSEYNVSLFTYFLMHLGMFDNNSNFLICHKSLVDVLLNVIKEKEIDDFESVLNKKSKESNININDVDLMTGVEFENFIGNLFLKMGYSVEVTKASGDQGVDVIAKKNGQKIGIQAKCYSNTVSNSAIQEIVAGLKFYNLDKGIVVTNNYFTSSAAELAEANDIILWDRDRLKEKISELF